MAPDTPRSLLRSPIFENLDGSGALQAINSVSAIRSFGNGDRNEELGRTIFKLENGVYQAAGMAVYVKRTTGVTAKTSKFHVNRSDVVYRLVFVNGDAAGGRFANSVEVTLNGVRVISSAAVVRDSQPVVVPTRLTPDNTITVSLKGSTNATCLIAIEPVQPTTPLPLKPAVDCIWDEGNGLFTAAFGYRNDDGEERLVPNGSANAFDGDRGDRGQPTLFLPGEQHSQFWVQSNGENLTWILEGSSATATRQARACGGSAPVQRTN
jgi:hypothetical protein